MGLMESAKLSFDIEKSIIFHRYHDYNAAESLNKG